MPLYLSGAATELLCKCTSNFPSLGLFFSVYTIEMNYLAEQIPGQQISIEQISYYYFKNNLLSWHLSVWDFFKHLGVLYGI